MSLVHLLKGDLEQAIVRLEHALGLCRFWQIPIPLVLVTSQLGYVYALSGRLAEAIPLLAEGVELSKGRWGRSQRMAWLAEAHLLAGRTDQAGELTGQGLELARAHKERGYEAWALRLLGEIDARRAPHSLTALSIMVSRTGWRSNVDRLITLSTSLVAVCCSSASLNVLVISAYDGGWRTTRIGCEGRAALLAEPRLRAILVLAPGTVHAGGLLAGAPQG